MRVVSLIPAATEIVADLGCADLLVGRSHECDAPGSARLPVVSAGRIDPAGLTGPQIDGAVREAVASGTPLYAVDADLLDRLRPDLVITQDLCRVCAVSSGEVHLPGIPVLSLDPRTIPGIAESVRDVARALGVPERGEVVARDMLDRVEAVRRRVAGRPRRRVFVAEWHDPPFAAGHWVPEQVAAAGGADPLGRPGERSRPTTWDAVVAIDPEVVVVAPCGYDEAGARAEWARACAAGSVPPDLAGRAVFVDANAHHSRPSPAVARGVEVLAALLHGA